MCGILRSVTSASNRSAVRRSIASRPDEMATVSYSRSPRPSAIVRAISTLSSTTMTRGRRLPMLGLLGARQDDGGPRPPRFGLREDQPPAMAGDDLVRDREAQAGAAL